MLIDRTIKPELGVGLRRGHWSTDGMVAHYALNESGGVRAYDLAGNNDGTLTGYAAGEKSWDAGALNFPGTNEYVLTTGARNLPQIVGSFAFRVKPRTVGTAIGAFVEISNGAANRIVFYIAAGGAQLALFATGSGSGNNVWLRTAAATYLPNNIWHSVVVNYNILTDIYSVYIDSQLIPPSSSDIAGGASGIDQINIGSFRDGSVLLDGQIDYMSIYNRTLSRSEIMALDQNSDIVYEPEWIPEVAAAVAGVEIFRRRIEGY